MEAQRFIEILEEAGFVACGYSGRGMKWPA